MKTVNISTNVPIELAKMLEKVANFEERSKSYYIKKGLAELLEKRVQDMEDYLAAQKEHDEFIKSKEKAISFKEVFKNKK